MSHHHHHPHEGHSEGNPPGEKPLRHNWFFYVAGVFLVLALIGFILSNNLSNVPGLVSPPANAAPIVRLGVYHHAVSSQRPPSDPSWPDGYANGLYTMRVAALRAATA